MKIIVEAPSKDFVEDALHLAIRVQQRAARASNIPEIVRIHNELAKEYQKAVQSIQLSK